MKLAARKVVNLASQSRIKFSSLYWLTKTQLIYRQSLGSLGSGSKIIKPLQLKNIEYIHIGRNVLIHKYIWLMTVPQPGTPDPHLVIGDGAVLGHFNHITCINRVEIGHKVLTADGVHISDNSHGFKDPGCPIMDQPVYSKAPVSIGDGTWLGENVSVLSCRVGRHCVIGANAVVTRDIPDYSVAVGVPARVIRRFNTKSLLWEDIPLTPPSPDGE